MAKFRLKLEHVDGTKYKHKYNIMLEAKNPHQIITKIEEALEEEKEARQKILFEERKSEKDYYDELEDIVDEDQIDWQSKGDDISGHDYLKNEIELEYLE